MDDKTLYSRGERIWHWFRWLFLVAAILWQCLHQNYLGNLLWGFFNPDKVTQVAAAQSLLDGQGLTMLIMDFNDPGNPRREPVVHWPPGYSVAFAAVKAVTHDVWRTNLLLDILASVLVFTAWFTILESLSLRIGAAAKLLFWVYFGLVWNPLLLMTSTENLALGAYSWALAWVLISARSRHALLAAAASGACAAAAAAFRYPYWPLILAPPVAIAVAGIVRREGRRWALASAVCLALAALLLGSLAGWQRAVTGHTTCLTSVPAMQTRGMHWDNLLQVWPFPATAIGLADVWNTFVKEFHCGAVAARGYWITSACVIFGLLLLLCRRWRQWRDWLRLPGAPAMAAFIAAGLLTAAVTIAVLAWLSVRTPADIWQNGFTYVSEPRYYAVFYPFVQLALACSIVRTLAWAKRRCGRITQLVLLGALIAWIYVGLDWRMEISKLWLQERCGVREQRREDRNNMRLLHAEVRRQVEAGRTVLFADLAFNSAYGTHCERFALEVARMAGACKLPPAAAARVTLTAARPTALLVLVPDRPEKDPQGLAQALVRDAARFTRTVHLRDGSLYTALSP